MELQNPLQLVSKAFGSGLLSLAVWRRIYLDWPTVSRSGLGLGGEDSSVAAAFFLT